MYFILGYLNYSNVNISLEGFGHNGKKIQNVRHATYKSRVIISLLKELGNYYDRQEEGTNRM
jgi:hypothetical protein